MQYLDEHLEKLEASLKKKKTKLLAAGAELSEERRVAAQSLDTAVETELKDLSMPGARFRVSFMPKPGEGFDASGLEDVRFLLSANAGQAPGRLSHIASGGELSRIMLAMKNVLRASADPEVLIFDEIDTGVSGDISVAVGRIMGRMADRMQVVAITHLPQIAARATQHLKVYKVDDGDATVSRIRELDSDARVAELAVMLSSEPPTAAALQTARELMEK